MYKCACMHMHGGAGRGGMSIRSHFGSKPLRGGARRLSVNLGDRGDDGFFARGRGFGIQQQWRP